MRNNNGLKVDICQALFYRFPERSKQPCEAGTSASTSIPQRRNLECTPADSNGFAPVTVAFIMTSTLCPLELSPTGFLRSIP